MGKRRRRLHRARLKAKRQLNAATTNPVVGIENSVVQEMLTETTVTPVIETVTTPMEIEETTPVLEAITPPTKKATRKTTRPRATKKKTPTKRTTRRRTQTNSSK